MSEYQRFVADFHEHFTRDPNECLGLGIDKHLDDLPDPSIEWAQEQARQGTELLARSKHIAVSELNFDEQLDLELAQLWLARDSHNHSYRFNGRTKRQQTPRAGEDIGGGLFSLFVRDPRPEPERLANITARIEKVPAFLQKMLERLDCPVQRWVETDVEVVRGLPLLFSNLDTWASELSWDGLSRFRSASAEAESALDAYVDKLLAMPTTTRFVIGDETARRILDLNGLDLSFDELHRLAIDFSAETRATIETLRTRLVNKYHLEPDASADAVHEFLNEKYRLSLEDGDLNRILDRYEEELVKVLDFVEKRNLFNIFEQQAMKIIRTPEYLTPVIPAGAMVDWPPFREGVRTSIIFLTLSEALVDEHTELSIPSMLIHEGIPGHHLQLATASLQASVIRRHIYSGAHSEGWATMLEDYMLDLGYAGDLTDEVRFVTKRELARIGARVAIDLFFMTGRNEYLDIGIPCDFTSDDPFEAAGNLLRAATGFTEARIPPEVNWYSQSPGYPLSYLAGNHLVWGLKRDIQKAQQGKLEGLELDRVFHRINLESGTMPLSFIRRICEHEGLL